MSNGTKCHYLQCPNGSVRNPDLHFFRFPVKDKERCCSWLINSGRDDFIDLPDNTLKNRRLCSKHFETKFFTNNKQNKLNYNAIPIPHFVENFTDPSEILENDRPAPVIVENVTNLSQILENDITPSVIVENVTPAPVITNKENESYSDFLTYFKPLSDTVEKTDVTPRKKLLFKRISKHKKTIQKQIKLLTTKRSRISFLKKKKVTVSKPDILSLLSQHVTGDVLTFIKMQLNDKNTPWSDEEKYLSLSLYYKSPSVYSFLRSRGFRLPCLTKIRDWINVYNLSTGFTEEVFSKLSMKAQTMTEDEKQCVLLLDEMTIKKGLQYDRKNDLIEGFQDLGPLGRSDCVASHVLLFMIRGLKYPWKLPVAYVLSSNSAKKSIVSLLTDICLEKVFETGLQVRAIVCDLGSTNAASYSLVGVTPENPFLFFKNYKIYCFFDAPHLIKNIRNTLLGSDILVGENVVSWKDIEEFFNVDRNQPNDCRAAPKLTERHISPNQFQKMKVKLATQVFSASVSHGMKAANNLALVKSDSVLNTANFLSKMNDITDALNSRSVIEKCPLRRPLGDDNPQIEKCLKDALTYIDSWKLNKFVKLKTGVKRMKNPPCFNGLKSTIFAVLSLHKDLQEEGNAFLLTSRLNQDPLENMFGVIRQRGGYNNNPTAMQFRRSLQHAISIRLMNPPSTSNCEPDYDQTLILESLDNSMRPSKPESNLHSNSNTEASSHVLGDCTPHSAMPNSRPFDDCTPHSVMPKSRLFVECTPHSAMPNSIPFVDCTPHSTIPNSNPFDDCTPHSAMPNSIPFDDCTPHSATHDSRPFDDCTPHSAMPNSIPFDDCTPHSATHDSRPFDDCTPHSAMPNSIPFDDCTPHSAMPNSIPFDDCTPHSAMPNSRPFDDCTPHSVMPNSRPFDDCTPHSAMPNSIPFDDCTPHSAMHDSRPFEDCTPHSAMPDSRPFDDCTPHSAMTDSSPFDNTIPDSCFKQMDIYTPHSIMPVSCSQTSINNEGLSHQKDSFPELKNTSEKQTISLEDAVINYMAGWAAKKCIDEFSCEKCKSSLVKKSDLTVPEESLIRCKEYIKYFSDGKQEESLKTPSAEMYSVMKLITKSFTKHFPSHKSQLKINEKLSSLIKLDVEEQYETWLRNECKEHNLFIINKFTLMMIFYKVKWLSEDIRDASLLRLKRNMVEDHSQRHQGKQNTKLMKLKNL